MNKGIIGGIISLVIGGASFAISKSDIVDNFSKDTGLSKQESQQYVDKVQSNLTSFSSLGSSLLKDGNSAVSSASELDCYKYTYTWATNDLTCSMGKDQLLTIGNSEVNLGNCYIALGTDLGNTAKDKIKECIKDIDTSNYNDTLPIVNILMDQKTITDQRNSNSYNKSVLLAALK